MKKIRILSMAVAAVTAIAYKDKVYRIPQSVTTRGLIYNKDIFKAAGLVDESGEPTPPLYIKRT